MVSSQGWMMPLSTQVGDPVDGRLDEVDGAGLQRELALGEHRILVGLLEEVDLDAGLVGEGVEHLLEVDSPTSP